MDKKGAIKFTLLFLALLSIFVISVFALVGFAADDVNVATHTPKITLTPEIANCNQDLPNEFTVHVENTNDNGFGIYNVKIYKAPPNINILDCGTAPSGWTSQGFRFGLYCEYDTDPLGNDTIEEEDPGLDFTFEATINQSECISTFRITTLDNEAIITGSGEGTEVNTFRNLTVDCTPPILNKTVGEPKILIDPACNPETQSCDYWITDETVIDFEAFDDDKCDLGIDYCEWRFTLDDGSPEEWERIENEERVSWEAMFDEDSNHFIEAKCFDKAGNLVELSEMDKVDKTPPITNKTFNGPQKIENGVEWIDGITTITLQSEDPDPTGEQCNVGVDKIWYANILSQDEDVCWHPEECEPIPKSPYKDEKTVECINDAQAFCDENWEREGFDSWEDCVEKYAHKLCGVNEEWKLYRGEPIPKDNESCHIFEFFSVDNLGNVEDVNTNCFFVDETKPELDKDNGDAIEGFDENLPINGTFHWISPSMPITFTCSDQGPHPSGDEEVCFKVSYDKDPSDLTDIYADKYKTTVGDDGFACVPVNGDNQFEFNFNENEDTLHDLEYYCKDAVEKRTETRLQWYKVDSLPPVIEKEMFGSWLGDCPPRPDSDDKCYVADNGQSGVSIWVKDDTLEGHPTDVACRVLVWWLTVPQECIAAGGEWNEEKNLCLLDAPEFGPGGEIHHDIFFREDSTHFVELSCVDSLGNEIHDEERFLVDSTPPKTEKKIGEPLFTCEDWCRAEVGYEGPGDGFEACLANSCFSGNWDCAYEYNEYENGNGEYDHEIICRQPEWINSSTPITLNANDTKVGVDKIWYRNDLAQDLQSGTQTPDDICQNPQIFCNSEYIQLPDTPYDDPDSAACIEKAQDVCDEKFDRGTDDWFDCVEEIVHDDEGCDVNEEWKLYRGTPITKDEESCHVLQWFSVDYLGNVEETQLNCFFVDNTPPEGIKEVGEPSVDLCPLDDEEGENGDNGNNHNSPGDLIGTVNFSTPCPSGIGVGIAYDGENLWYSCGLSGSSPDLFRADPLTGVVDASYDIVPGSEGLGALAYDASRNAIWAGWDDSSGEIRLIHLDGLKNVSSTTSEFFAPEAIFFSLDDGLAYDASDDTLYISGDVAPDIHHYKTDGTHLGGFAKVPGSTCGNSGLALGGELLYQGFNGCNQVIVVNKSDTSTPVFNFSTAVGSDPGFRDEDLECDTNTFDVHVMWSVEAFEPRRALAFEVPANTCGIGGVASSCGDNVLDAGEQCDDGNNLNDDGCSATCRLEKACELDWAVNQETPIWISCRDPVPHPVDHEKIGFRISFEDPPFLTERYCEEFGGEFDGDSGLCWIHENEFHFNFLEDSIHDLEFFCEDALGNVGEADVEFFAVDTKPPVIEKTIVGPSVGECPPQDQDDVCIIDGVTKIHVEAKDQEPHPVGGVQCGYEFTVDGGDPRITKDPLTPPFDIQFGEPSEHVLTITCWDALGNEVNDTETFLVDKTLPVIEKTIGDPQFSCYDWCAAECGGDESCWQECLYGEDSICEFNNKTGEWFPQWITNTTSIWAFAFDPEPHPSGLNSLSWRVRRVNDSACRSIALCNGTQGSGEWNSVEGDEAQAHFEISEESCHLIEIMATDNVNKTSIHKQCVFVDTSPPEPNKTVSEPKDRWTPGKNGDPNSTFYPAETRHCWDGTGQSIDCWQVTTLTPITLDCTETGPHPVNHEKVYFKVDFDGDDKTGDYCQDVNGTLQDNGYCLVDGQEAPFTLYFNEESEHNLKFYCEDALGNRGSIDEEKFKVEGSAFNITLYKKWNLISVPFVLVNNDPDTVFESIKEDVKAVWSYDAESDNWDAWRPGENLTNTLNEIKPGWGYWIEMKNESVLIIGGSLFSPAVTPPSRPMVPGWNLIGYYGNKDINGDAVLGHDCVQVPEGKEAICSLNSLVDTVIGRPRWSSLWTYCEAIAPVDKFISLNEHQQMTPGAGYWLEMDIEDSYAPATTCSGLI